MRKSLLVIALIAVLAFSSSIFAADVAVLNSDLTKDWYTGLGWDFDAELENIFLSLDILGLDYVEISDEQMAAGDFADAALVILPNNRMMEEAAADAVKAYVADGGKVFGLYQSSFRNAENQNVNEANNFQLDTIYNISFTSWTGTPPLHGYIKGDADHAIWEGLPEFVRTSRNTAMVVRTLPGGTVVGEWFNDDMEWESQMDNINAAIIVSDNAVYVGEMLFDVDVYEDANVRQLIENIINYLIG